MDVQLNHPIQNHEATSGLQKRPAYTLFRGLGVMLLVCAIWKTFQSEMPSHGEDLQPTPMDPLGLPNQPGLGKIALAAFIGRKLLSLTGQAFYPKAPAFDLASPVEHSFSLGPVNDTTYLAISEQRFIDGSLNNNSRIWGTFGDATSALLSQRIGDEPFNFIPHKYSAQAKGTDGNIGVVHSTHSFSSSGLEFLILDPSGSEVVAPIGLISKASDLEFIPSTISLPNGNYVVGYTDTSIFRIYIRSGSDGSSVGTNTFTVPITSDLSRKSSMAPCPDSSFFIAADATGTSGTETIRLIKSDSTGNAVGSTFDFEGASPKITRLANGNSAVYYLDGSNQLMQKEFTFSGTAFTEVATRTISTRFVLDYDVTERPDGTWTAAVSDGLTYLQPIEVNGTVVKSEVPANGGLAALWPRLTNLGQDLALGFKSATVNATAWIQIFRANLPPVVSTLGNFSLYFNQSQVVDLTTFRTDPDEAEGEMIAPTLIQGTAFTSLQGDDLHINPNTSHVGTTSPIEVQFEDEDGHEVSTSGFVTIENFLPTFTTPGPISQNVQEGAEQLLTLPAATDPESSVIYSLEGNPAWAVIDGGNIRLTPPIGASTTSFNVVATDVNGGRNTKQVTATVTDDPAPIFTETGTLQIGVDEGDSLTRSFPPATDNGPFTYSITGLTWVTEIVESTVVTGYQVAPPVGVSGTFLITFHAVDEHGQETTRAGEVTVADVPAPAFSDTSPLSASVTAGLSQTLTLPTVTGQKRPFIYSLTGSPPSWATLADGELALDPPDGIAGDFSFTLVGTDQLGQPTPPLSVQTTVVANLPPAFVETGTLALAGTAGTSSFFEFPEVNDEGDITWTLETEDGSPLPPWAKINSNSYSFEPPVDGAGDYSLRLVATDSQGLQAGKQINFKVAAPPSGGSGDDKFFEVTSTMVVMFVLGVIWRGYKFWRNKDNKEYRARFGMKTAVIEIGYAVAWPFFAARSGYRFAQEKWYNKNSASALEEREGEASSPIDVEQDVIEMQSGASPDTLETEEEA